MNNPVNDFIKRLDSLERSSSTREKFRDIVELFYCALAKLTAPSVERAEALEARYMSIVNRYPDKDTIRAYPEIMAIAWETVAAGGCDFLGDVASQLAALDADKGQFFTPWNVSRLMAEMCFTGFEEVIEDKGYITLGEPAAGAGSMVLAYADVLAGKGYDPTIHMLVNAVDVSPLAYQMCFLQLTWRGIPALVQRANTLTLECFEQAWTPPADVFYAHHGHLRFESSAPVQPAPEVVVPEPYVYTPYEPEPLPEDEPSLVQLTLF